MTDQESTFVEERVGTARTCPQCHQSTDGPGRYCAFCGSPLDRTERQTADGGVVRRRLGGVVDLVPASAIGSSAADSGETVGEIPASTLPVKVVPSSRRRRRRSRPWYMRRLFLVPALLLLLAGMGTLAVAWRVNSSVSTIHEISTPEPLVSGDRLGGDKRVVVDTGPAQEAVRSYPEARPQGDGGTGVGDTITGMTSSAALAAGVQDEASPGTMNILLMGVDARPGEAIDIGVRPDALAVLHLDADTGGCRMLAIPRDSRIELPGYGLSKANHALAVGGIPYQEQVVEQFLDIPIDHYGLIDFAGIEQLVDAVGGITVENTQSFSIGGTTFEAGTQTLDGKRALLYARYRGGSDGDFGRIGRQQQILRAVLQNVSGRDLLTLIPRLLPVLEDHTRTSLDPAEMIDIATYFRSTCTEQTFETRTLAGTVATFPDPLLELDLSYVIIDEAEVRKQVAWLLGD